jgi:hypothetical protein
MKALISPKETLNVSWVSSWIQEDGVWVPVITEVIGCYRIAEVEQVAFDVADPMFWIDCPDECKPNTWYFKDNQVQPIPPNEPQPE